jgi:hypothetical protein
MSCDTIQNCSVPPCETTAGTGGTTGSGGTTGAGGAGGTADCSVCTNADDCCTAIANGQGASCTLAASCDSASGAQQQQAITVCQSVLTAAQSPRSAAGLPAVAQRARLSVVALGVRGCRQQPFTRPARDQLEGARRGFVVRQRLRQRRAQRLEREAVRVREPR